MAPTHTHRPGGRSPQVVVAHGKGVNQGPVHATRASLERASGLERQAVERPDADAAVRAGATKPRLPLASASVPHCDHPAVWCLHHPPRAARWDQHGGQERRSRLE